jgi:hypothetical protein
MTRRTVAGVIGAFLVCALTGMVYAYQTPFDLAASILSPTDVIGLIDKLTRKDSDTSVSLKVGITTSHGKLLVARTRVDVGLERSSRNWRGRVMVQLTVPSEVSYSVDLAEIRPEHIRVDKKERILTVQMPMPRVEDVTPILADVKTVNTCRHARFKCLDKPMLHELENTMLKEDYLARARQKGEEQLPEIRKQGCEALQEFLQKLISGTCPGVVVVVE